MLWLLVAEGVTREAKAPSNAGLFVFGFEQSQWRILLLAVDL